RADDGAEHPEPLRFVGGGQPPGLRRWRHGLLDDPVPRGGRPARRSRRHHRPRPARRGGHARTAKERDRPPDRRGRAPREGAARGPRLRARALRQPAQIVPALVFPLFLLAVNTGGLQRATRIPGFPTDSYLTFLLAVAFMQGALFSVMNAGTDLARDVETGFLNRLALTPLRGPALLAGLLAGVVALSLVQAATYLTVALAAGASVAAGLPGVLVIVALPVSIT